MNTSPSKGSASPNKSPRKKISEIASTKIQSLSEQIEAHERETANLRKELAIAREKALTTNLNKDSYTKTMSNLGFKVLEDTVQRL